MSWSTGMPETIAQKFDRLFCTFTGEDFMNGKKLGGDIASYISTYPPEEENMMKEQIAALKNRLDKQGRSVLIINLYEVIISILTEKKLLDRVFSSEQKMPKKRLFDSLVNTLDVQNVLLPFIVQKIHDSAASIVFLTGIGHVFPIIRAHTVMNNIQKIVSKTPLVAFFPGDYDGIRLKLFGRLQDENHYRAFPLDTQAQG
jgi:hypothetical protein